MYKIKGDKNTKSKMVDIYGKMIIDVNDYLWKNDHLRTWSFVENELEMNGKW